MERRQRESCRTASATRPYDCIDNSYYGSTLVYTLPAGHVFGLGGNGDNWTDSRVMTSTGYVPMDHLVGRVSRIFWSLAEDGDPRMERFWQAGR